MCSSRVFEKDENNIEINVTNVVHQSLERPPIDVRLERGGAVRTLDGWHDKVFEMSRISFGMLSSAYLLV